MTESCELSIVVPLYRSRDTIEPLVDAVVASVGHQVRSLELSSPTRAVTRPFYEYSISSTIHRKTAAPWPTRSRSAVALVALGCGWKRRSGHG